MSKSDSVVRPSYSALLTLAYRGDARARAGCPMWAPEYRAWYRASRWSGSGDAPEDYAGKSDAELRPSAYAAIQHLNCAHDPARTRNAYPRLVQAGKELAQMARECVEVRDVSNVLFLDAILRMEALLHDLGELDTNSAEGSNDGTTAASRGRVAYAR